MKRTVQSFDDLCKSLGFPYTGDQVVEELTKALTTTNSGPITVPRTSPLMLENMDGLMTEVLLTEQHFKLLNAFPRVPSAGPYFEWNRHSSFGTRRSGGLGFAEGGGPKGGVSAFIRNGIYNKYLGVRGGLTHQMLIAGQNGGTVEDPETRENHDRTLELFERMERELVFGMKSVKDASGNEVNFDGLLTLMNTDMAANVIDMKGAPLTYANFDDAAVDLVTNGKQQTVNGYTSFMSVHVAEGLNKMYQDANIVRELKEGKTATYSPGFKVPGYETQFGYFEFEHTLLLEEVPNSAPLTAADASAPAAPATVTPSAVNDAASTLAAGTYYYSVSSFNDYGESLMTTSQAQAIEAGQKASIVIADTTGATGFRIYRGLESDGSDAKWIGRAAKGTTTTTFVDAGGWMTQDASSNPQNGVAIVIKPEPKDLVLAQMAPLMKMPLPQTETTFPFLLLLYCVLVLKAPERVRIFKNCGKYNPA